MNPIKLDTFNGIRPRVHRQLLPASSAQKAKNCNIDSGILVPFHQSTVVDTVPAGTKSIYPYNGRWLNWTRFVKVVKSPIAEDTYDRIYYNDGTGPKVRGKIGAVESEHPLGIPKPVNKPTITIQQKTATSWTRTWKYFYEESDGTQEDAGALVVTEPSPGQTGTATIPARVTASPSAVFVAWFEAYSATSVLLGRVYPDISKYRANSDLFIDGAIVSMTQVNAGVTATMTITYDTSSASNYTRDRSWVYTFVSEFEEEGRPSTASDVTAMDPTQDAVISNMDTTAPAGYTNITKKRIYRTVTGNAGTTFRFVVEIPLAQASYTDSVADLDTEEALPSTDWAQPPTDLDYLVGMPGEFLAGISKNTVYFSEPGYPHAWPVDYAVTLDIPHASDGTLSVLNALGVSGTSLSVLSQGGYPYLISAVDPASATVLKIPTMQPCSSPAGVIEWEGAVLYTSPDGLMVLSGVTGIVQSDPYFTPEQWKVLSPTTMRLASYNNKIFIFSDTDTIVFKLGAQENAITTLDFVVSASYTDMETDLLYVVIGGQILSFDQSPANLTMTWKSREYLFPRPVWLSVGRIISDGYPATLNLYTNNVLSGTVIVPEDMAFRLPKIQPSKYWSFEVVANHTIREMLVGQNMREL